MKNNLEAKFTKELLIAIQKEDSNIVELELEIDNKIDVPSNTQVIDCTKFYKEATKNVKSTKKESQTS